MAKPLHKPPVVFEPTSGNWRQMIIPGIILILVGILVPAWFEMKLASVQDEYDMLLAKGVPSQARVLEKRTHEDRMALTLDPLPPGGETLKREVSEQAYQSAVVGEPVDILALPEDPASAQLVMDMQRPTRKIFVFFLPLLVIGGLLYIRKGLSMRRLTHALDQEGLTAPARLLERWTEDSSDDTAYFVSFGFTAQTPEGAREMLLCTVNQKGYDAQEAGTPVHVRYLSYDPEQCRLEFGK